MAPALLGGIIAAGASLTGSLVDTLSGAKQSRANTDKTNATNILLAREGYRHDVDMWNRANAYNSPQAQMQRFKDAGLNPHLIYGQGSAGNAVSAPSFRTPHVEYNYQAPRYGAAIQSVVPMLMEVGSWMQDMRLKDAQVRSVESGIDKSWLQQQQLQQLIKYLEEKNPKQLEKLQNELSLYPYQSQMKANLAERSRAELWAIGQKFRSEYGEELFKDSGMVGSTSAMGGLSRLRWLQQEAEARLKQAKASYTDFNITDPQALMQMVLGGVMSMAGQQLRISTMPRRKYSHEVEERMRNGRVKIRRRSYE